MTVSFNAIPFDVATGDGRLPFPKTEESSGFEWYEAEVFVRSRANLFLLRALVTQITPRPALGMMRAGTVVVERGVGEKSLIYPDGAGETTVLAILTGFTPRAMIERRDIYRVALKFLLTGAHS